MNAGIYKMAYVKYEKHLSTDNRWKGHLWPHSPKYHHRWYDYILNIKLPSLDTVTKKKKSQIYGMFLVFQPIHTATLSLKQ